MLAAPAKPVGLTLLDRIGNTPLLRLDGMIPDAPGIQILGKAEWTNPGGSVKDRAASAIVADAIRQGQLTPGSSDKALLDATSGNTGIAYAMLGAAMGFPVTLCVPSNVSPERKNILAAYGANVLWTDPADGSDGAIRMARKLIAEHPEKFFYADQYGNDNNWRAHYYSTANEIWQQTSGQITHFVAGLGTSGTFMGTTRRLRELNPQHPVHLHAARLALQRPRGPQAHGHRHRSAHLRPRPRRPQHRHAHRARLRHVQAPRAHPGPAPRHLCRCRRRRRAATSPKRKPAPDREAVIVTILPDSADKYLSDRFWSEDHDEEAIEAS